MTYLSPMRENRSYRVRSWWQPVAAQMSGHVPARPFLPNDENGQHSHMAVTSPVRRHAIIPAWLDLGRFFADRRFALLWMSCVLLGLILITAALSFLSAYFLFNEAHDQRPLGFFVLAVAGAFFVLAVASGWTTLTKLAGWVIERRRARVR